MQNNDKIEDEVKKGREKKEKKLEKKWKKGSKTNMIQRENNKARRERSVRMQKL